MVCFVLHLCWQGSKFPGRIHKSAVLTESRRVPILSLFLPAKALSNDVQANERRVSLDGIWKFLYSRNIDACPKNFFKPDFNTKNWSDIEVPGSWELQGFDCPIYTDVKYPFPLILLCSFRL